MLMVVTWKILVSPTWFDHGINNAHKNTYERNYLLFKPINNANLVITTSYICELKSYYKKDNYINTCLNDDIGS